jgi:hypothetical protein
MVRQSVAEIRAEHVTFELEAIDRMYVNADVPSLQTGAGFVYFVKTQLQARVPSTMLVAPMSRRFVEALEQCAKAEGVDVVTFERGERKDDVMQRYLAGFDQEEGLLFIGKAQEKASVFRTEKRRDARGTHPWIVRSTAMVTHYYVYLVDRDFGPLFLEFCSYFPYPAKLCLNGHEWLKRQLTRRNIPFTPLDNGLQASDRPARVQRIADAVDAAKIRGRVPQVVGAAAASLHLRPPRRRVSRSALDPAGWRSRSSGVGTPNLVAACLDECRTGTR